MSGWLDVWLGDLICGWVCGWLSGWLTSCVAGWRCGWLSVWLPSWCVPFVFVRKNIRRNLARVMWRA